MAKVSPVSIKYMIHASLNAEGALEKPDVIGALFGQFKFFWDFEKKMLVRLGFKSFKQD